MDNQWEIFAVAIVFCIYVVMPYYLFQPRDSYIHAALRLTWVITEQHWKTFTNFTSAGSMLGYFSRVRFLFLAHFSFVFPFSVYHPYPFSHESSVTCPLLWRPLKVIDSVCICVNILRTYIQAVFPLVCTIIASPYTVHHRSFAFMGATTSPEHCRSHVCWSRTALCKFFPENPRQVVLFICVHANIFKEGKQLSFRFQERWRTSSSLRTTSDPPYSVYRLPSSPLPMIPMFWDGHHPALAFRRKTLSATLQRRGKKKSTLRWTLCCEPALVPEDTLLAEGPEPRCLCLEVHGWDESTGLRGGTTLALPTVHRHLVLLLFMLCFLRCDSFRDPAEYVIDSPFCASPARPCCIWGARELLSCDTWKWNPVRNGSCPCEFVLYSNPSQSWRVCAAYNVSKRARHREVSLLAPY